MKRARGRPKLGNVLFARRVPKWMVGDLESLIKGAVKPDINKAYKGVIIGSTPIVKKEDLPPDDNRSVYVKKLMEDNKKLLKDYMAAYEARELVERALEDYLSNPEGEGAQLWKFRHDEIAKAMKAKEDMY